MNRLLAQLTIGNEKINSPLDPKLQTVGDVVGRITNFLIPIGAVILLFVLIWGGYDFMLSQGSPDKIKSARLKITTGLIGFVLMVFAYIITKFVANIFDLGGGLM